MPSYLYPELNSSLSRIVLVGDECHHLVHVMRKKPGDQVNINSGKGWFGKGTIESISKTQVSIDITGTVYYEQIANYAIAFSLLRNKNDELLVEKVTELGVTDLFPMTSRYSVRNPSKNTLARFQMTALNAIKQCDNPWLPLIHPIQSLELTIDTIQQNGYIPVLASEKRPDTWVDSLEKDKPYCFIIGPEGGFDDEEFAMFYMRKIQEVTISNLILRAETAAITIAAQYSLFNSTCSK